MAFDPAKVIIWLGQTLTFGWVINHYHGYCEFWDMLPWLPLLLIHPFRCVDPVLLIYKSTFLFNLN